MAMNKLPLLFTFRDKVSGNGFLADIEAQGRALAVRDEGEVWMNGVQPGGIAEGGENGSEAYAKFRQTYKAVLFDIASETKDFNEFKLLVEAFFHDISHLTEKEWWNAVKRVREEKHTEEGLPIKSAEETEVKVTVKKVEQFTPADNILIDAPQALAA